MTKLAPAARFPLGGPREGRFETRDPLDRYRAEPPTASGWCVPCDTVSQAPYVELHAHSAYSFLDGASLPDELAARAAELGYEALALTDHDGVYGSLEFAHAAKHFGVRAITGAEVTVAGGAHVTLLCETQRGYANLCRILTDAHARTRLAGRESELLPASTTVELVAEHAEGLVCLSGCARNGLGVVDPNAAADLARAFDGAFYVELQRPYERGDARRNAALADLAATLRVPTVATGDVHAHHPRRVRLQDALVAIRHRTSLDGCERERRGNHERVLVAPAEMLEGLPREAVLRTGDVADRCAFDLTQELGYRYPDFSDGPDPADAQLRQICDRAFADRYGSVRAGGTSRFPRDPLPWSASSTGGSAAGKKHRARQRLDDELASVPDIDLDFPRDIREKLIVAVTERYGREHAALVASFATYRSRGAIRDVGKALGLPYAELERIARVSDGWNAKRVAEELQLLPDADRKLLSPRWRAFGELCTEIAGLPRHISQHPGGMVISSRPLIEL